MQAWPVEDAAARFDELLDACLRDGPQLVTLGGVGLAVLVPAEQWRRVAPTGQVTPKELLLIDVARGNPRISPRGRWRRRIVA